MVQQPPAAYDGDVVLAQVGAGGQHLGGGGVHTDARSGDIFQVREEPLEQR